MAKKDRSEYSKLREKFLRRVRRLEKRGYQFPEDYIPEFKTNPSVEDIEYLNQDLDEIYRHASYKMREGSISGEQARRIEQEKRRAQAYINLLKAKRGSDDTNDEKIEEYRKQALIDTYNNLIDKNDVDALINFRKLLSDSDNKLLTEAIYEQNMERVGYGNNIVDETEETEDFQITDEPIEKTKRDPRYEEWKRKYDEERKKKPKERESIRDSTAIYYGMLNRISQFESLMREGGRFSQTHQINETYKFRLQGFLNMQIKLQGFDTVCKRLDENGHRIEELLQKMLFEDSKEGDIAPNFNEIVQIIKGEKLSMKEAEAIEQYSMEHRYTQDTEDGGEEYME